MFSISSSSVFHFFALCETFTRFVHCKQIYCPDFHFCCYFQHSVVMVTGKLQTLAFSGLPAYLQCPSLVRTFLLDSGHILDVSLLFKYYVLIPVSLLPIHLNFPPTLWDNKGYLYYILLYLFVLSTNNLLQFFHDGKCHLVFDSSVKTRWKEKAWWTLILEKTFQI